MFFNKRAADLTGILNGVDYAQWNPEQDPWLVSNYSAEDLRGKQQCKIDLLNQFGIQDSQDRPLIGIISRMADQKGFRSAACSGRTMVQEGFSMVVLGTGEERYTRFFLSLQEQYPNYVGAKISYDEWLAHKIEGGADLFLMPSRFEPCGLNQIYSLKYGTVPVVRATGGLDDTIQDYSQSPNGTGFKFDRLFAGGVADRHAKGVGGLPNPGSVEGAGQERDEARLFLASIGSTLCGALPVAGLNQ